MFNSARLRRAATRGLRPLPPQLARGPPLFSPLRGDTERHVQYEPRVEGTPWHQHGAARRTTLRRSQY